MVEKDVSSTFEKETRMRYCDLEKCSIRTKMDVRLLKKDHIGHQMLKIKTKEYLCDLERVMLSVDLIRTGEIILEPLRNLMRKLDLYVI